MRFLPLLLLPALTALGDEVRLRNGSTLVGEARVEGGRVVVHVGPGTVTLPARDVLEIRRVDGTIELPEVPPRRPEDASVRDAVLEELRADPLVGPIDPDVRDGVVTLRGRAPALAVVDRALALASLARGVRDVRSEVAIDARPDMEIQGELEEGTVKDGVVTVADRGADVRSLRGVREVRIENDVLAPPDADLRRNLEDALRWDAAVDHAKIHVAVIGGEARLTGAVLSAAEKRRAVEDAWAEGARAVDATGLEVDVWERDPSFRRGKYERLTDDAIRAAVERRTPGARVTVRGGEVRLDGEVATLRDARRAGRAARGVAGVRGVENRLTPRPAPMGDVAAALKRDVFVEEDVVVDAKDGVVRLTGIVGTTSAKAWADERAASVRGVRAVENALEVAAPGPLVADPYVDGLDARDYAWSPPAWRPSARPDGELRNEIERQFSESPFVDATRTRVAVLDGHAILSGTADSLVDRDAAERIALRSGAPAVTNRLLLPSE